MKVTIQMIMGSNESVTLEIPVEKIDQWDARVKPVLSKLEERVGDRARRIMAGNAQMKELFGRDPQTYNLVHNLVLLCLGQVPEPSALGLTDIPNAIPEMMQLKEAA